MFITQAPEAQFQQRQIGSCRYDNIHIDDRFGSHARDGSAANVEQCCSIPGLSQSLPNRATSELPVIRPIDKLSIDLYSFW